MVLFSDRSEQPTTIKIKFKVADVASECAFSFVKSIFPLFLIYKGNLDFTKENSYSEATSATLKLILIVIGCSDRSENSTIRSAVTKYIYMRGVWDDYSPSRTTLSG